MTTKDIRTSDAYTVCDVCGRTLLRGEKAEVYLNGGARRSVCELCKERAIHEGWVREGTVPAYSDSGAGSERRRSLFSRLRSRREPPPPPVAAPTLGDDLDGHSWSQESPPPRAAPRAPRMPSRERGERIERVREPRHVHAIPTSVEQKVASAIDLFNNSEHPRTISGVARSLGAPVVSVAPSQERPSQVTIAVSWELCWYRYEVDLADDVPSVRLRDQGYELEELPVEEQQPNAVADERGSLALGG